jgi:hypothetical protein
VTPPFAGSRDRLIDGSGARSPASPPPPALCAPSVCVFGVPPARREAAGDPQEGDMM